MYHQSDSFIHSFEHYVALFDGYIQHNTSHVTLSLACFKRIPNRAQVSKQVLTPSTPPSFNHPCRTRCNLWASPYGEPCRLHVTQEANNSIPMLSRHVTSLCPLLVLSAFQTERKSRNKIFFLLRGRTTRATIGII